jgi:urease accessory protein UreH
MVPEYAGNQFCRWIYPIVFGGGLVGGDQMEMNVETKPNTCGLLTSQESSKVSNRIFSNIPPILWLQTLIGEAMI